MDFAAADLDWRGRSLHLGCGDRRLPRPWINLDGRPGPAVDLVAEFDDLGRFPAGQLDAVYWSHGPEHVYPDKLAGLLVTLRERLRAGGELLVVTIDLAGIYENRFLSKANGSAWNAALYGECNSTDDPKLAHRQCFTDASLAGLLRDAGFADVRRWEPTMVPEIKALNDYAITCRLVSVCMRGVAR